MNKTNGIYKILAIITLCVDVGFAIYFAVCGILTLANQLVFCQTQLVVFVVAVVLNLCFLIYSLTMLKLHKK